MNKVSIIIPVYNAISYLDRCITSVLDQTYQEIELILVDDGSVDGSSELCDSYREKDERIVVVHQKNQGPALARKHGIRIASGEYLAFLDADDWLNKKMIGRMLKEIEDTQADMVCCQMVRVKNRGVVIHENAMQEEIIDCKRKIEHMHHFFATRYINSSCGSKLIKRILFDKIKLCENAMIGEDVSMIVSLLGQAKHVRIIKEELYYYYWNTSSISHAGYTEGHRIGFVNYMQMRDSLLIQYPLEQETIAGYIAEREMAVITAMCRNEHYDQEVIQMLRSDLYQYRKLIVKNRMTPIYMKLCACLIMTVPIVFITLFKAIHKITGR